MRNQPAGLQRKRCDVEENDVRTIITARYGERSREVFDAMRNAELRRGIMARTSVYEVPRGQDMFQRNLKALHFLATHPKESRDGLERMYADALADLGTVYPNGNRPGESVNLYEAWKHVLDTTADRARGKAA